MYIKLAKIVLLQKYTENKTKIEQKTVWGTRYFLVVNFNLSQLPIHLPSVCDFMHIANCFMPCGSEQFR